MGYSNGLLESEEKGGSGERGKQGLPGIGFKLTDYGNFDIDGKRLTDVSLPVDGRDATTKAYVDGEIGHHTGNFYHLYLYGCKFKNNRCVRFSFQYSERFNN